MNFQFSCSLLFSPLQPELKDEFVSDGLFLLKTAQLTLPLIILSPGVRNCVESCFSFLGQKIKNGYEQTQGIYHRYMPQRAKKVVDMTGKGLSVAGKVAVVGFSEFLDFSNSGGTKDPETSIANSLQRIAKHHPEFSNCCEFIANQVMNCYAKDAEKINQQVAEAVERFCADSPDPNEEVLEFIPLAADVGGGVNWFLNFSQDLISQTIKANALHLLANLVDQAFDPQHPFVEKERNPLGCLMNLLGEVVFSFENKLEEIANQPLDERADLYHSLFQEMSEKLLLKCFSNGASDIQLFHHTLPFMTLLKPLVWGVLEKQLPLWLERLYFETRPLDHLNWQDEFDRLIGLSDAHQLLKAPSYFLQHLIREKQGAPLDQLQPILEKWLEANDVENAKKLSQQMIEYGKEFLLTEDPIVQGIGSFIEKYFMERLLFNLLQFIPRDGDIPGGVYLLQQWMIKVSNQIFKGFMDEEDLHFYTKALNILLIPFGLDRKETFPLPPSICQMAWPSIQKLQNQILPQLMIEKGMQWPALRERVKHQGQFEAWLKDISLTITIVNIRSKLVAKGFQYFRDPKLKIVEKVNTWLPSPILTEKQQGELQELYDQFINNDNDEAIIELEFSAHNSLEALILQICYDVYYQYLKASNQEKMENILEEDNLEQEDWQPDFSFIAWLTQQIVEACQLLKLEQLSQVELDALRRALELKNALLEIEDNKEQKQLNQIELDELWPTLQPKFEALAQHLLGIFNYRNQENLPLPNFLKPGAEKIISTALPRILFEQAGDLILPQLERHCHEEQIKVLPKGERILQGCHLLVKDLLKHLPQWIDGFIDEAPNQLVNQVPDIYLSEEEKEYFALHLDDFVYQQELAFVPIWQWAESYLEGLLLKLMLHISQIKLRDLQNIQQLALEAKKQLTEREPADKKAEEILIKFTDQLFDFLGIKTAQNLFGIPPVIRKPLFVNFKKQVAQLFLGIHKLDYQLHHRQIEELDLAEEELPVSEVAQAVLVLTREGLDKATKEFAQPMDGQVKGVVYIYHPLNAWLDKQKERGFDSARLFKEVMAEQIPLVEKVFHLLDAENGEVYKQEVAEWINPILTEKVLQVLHPLLEKEIEGQAVFDQTLLAHLLPLLINHFKHLNQAAKHEGGLNHANFIAAVGKDLHPAIPVKGDEKAQKLQRQEHFYKKQVDLMFQIIFPKGKEDLILAIPHFPLTPEQLDPIWNAAKKEVAEQLPQMINTIFSEELIRKMMGTLLENIIEGLEQPIKVKDKLARLDLLDQQVGELVLEIARFIDLPINRMKRLPEWVKRIIEWNKLEKRSVKAIGVAMRKQFNGRLLVKTIQRTLAKVAEKLPAHPKNGLKAKEQPEEIAQERMEKLEEEAAYQIPAFIFRLIGAKIEHVTDVFTHPVIKAGREVILSVCSFVMVKVIACILRLFKIERFVVNRFHEGIRHAVEKTVQAFSNPYINENFIYRAVEDFEDLLGDQPV